MALQAEPVTGEYFVALFDLTNFGKFYRSQSSELVFQRIAEFARLSTQIIEKAGGRIIKFHNDSGIAVFSAEEADRAVLAMIKLKSEVDQWAKQKVPGSQFAMNAHVGSATWGTLPNGNQEIVGEAVGMVYTMGKKQFLLSPQTFRKLSADTRKVFRKFTPPIVYRLDA